MARNFETCFTNPPYDIEPYVDPTPVSIDDELVVAQCLYDDGRYEGYDFDGSFTERQVMELAIADARQIISDRHTLLKQRSYLSDFLAATLRRNERAKLIANTRYAVVSTPVDKSA